MLVFVPYYIDRSPGHHPHATLLINQEAISKPIICASNYSKLYDLITLRMPKEYRQSFHSFGNRKTKKSRKLEIMSMYLNKSRSKTNYTFKI